MYRGKSPIKMHFPMFGRLEDTQDPLLYLEKCNDFLALHPLTDAELIATLRNVLHGTARDSWDVARVEMPPGQHLKNGSGLHSSLKTIRMN